MYRGCLKLLSADPSIYVAAIEAYKIEGFGLTAWG